MALTNAEIEALRFHLGYGSITLGASAYSPDGFQELFSDVVSPYLSTGAETSATTLIAAGAIVTVTPLSMTDIVANGRLVIDVGDDAETVVVKVVTMTTFVARFAKAHAASGYPIAVESGVSRLRLMLYEAEVSLQLAHGKDVSLSSGLKSADNNEVVWFESGAMLTERQRHYVSIVEDISRLVRVPINGGSSNGGRSIQLEAY